MHACMHQLCEARTNPKFSRLGCRLAVARGVSKDRRDLPSPRSHLRCLLMNGVVVVIIHHHRYRIHEAGKPPRAARPPSPGLLTSFALAPHHGP